MPPNTEEDKVRGLSPHDFKRLVIALLSNADIPGVKTPWTAKEPEQIFSQDIRTADTFYSSIVDWTNGKRLVIKVESSLDQAVTIQVIGNITNTTTRAVDINSPLPCTANGNISVGLAWDDWHPYIAVEITTAVAPTTGTLTIWAVIQE